MLDWSPFFAVVSLYEPWKYGLFSLLVPLYTRILKKDVDKHEKRGMIIGYVEQNPGATYSEIKDALVMGNGQCTEHLKKLEEVKKIKSKTTGVNKRFFPEKFDLKKVPPEIGHPIQQKIVKKLSNSPLLTQKELSDILGIKKGTIRYHLNTLVNHDRVKITKPKHRNKKEYSLIENGHYTVEESYRKTLTDPHKK